MGDDQLLRTATVRGVARLTLDSPHNRNALSSALIDQLIEALRRFAADPAVRVIVLDHAGPVFCSGVDLAETAAARAAGTIPAARLGELLGAVWHSPKPVVARVAGAARAGGLGLIAAADIAVCAAEATFAFTEVRLGVIPAVISATVLRRLSPRAAAELYLTGDIFDGLRAAAVGLVTAAVPRDGLDDAVAGYVTALTQGAPGALAGVKRLLGRVPLADFGDEIAELTEVSVGYFRSAEGVEGVRAFREKRPPGWVPESPG
jgi:methylglutaconyl-CoA hydratase